MTIKSLTITENAYDALQRLKHGDESFSEVILRVSKEKIGQAAKFFGALKMKPKEIVGWQERMKKNRILLEKEFTMREKKIRQR